MATLAYTYRTSRGKLCYLHSRLARLPTGRERRYYFFAYRPQPALLEPALPPGYEIVEAYGSGFPALRRHATADDASRAAEAKTSGGVTRSREERSARLIPACGGAAWRR